MWRKNNMAWIGGITAGLVLFLSCVRAETPPPTLDVSHAEFILRLVERWLDEGAHDARGRDTPPMIVSGLAGVRVTLRMSGITVGSGEAWVDDGEPADLVAQTHLASDAAFRALRKSLLNAQLNAEERPELSAEMRDALRGRGANKFKEKLTISDVATRIQPDVQLAYRIEPIQMPSGAPGGRVYTSFAPGYHGLIASDPGTGKRAWRWPANTLASNISPSSQLVHLVKSLGLDPVHVHSFGRPNGLALERFSVYHVAYPQPDLIPIPLERGNALLPPRTITETTLHRMASELAGHLLRRFTSDGAVRGTYHPTSGRYDPPLAEPAEALLAAYALTRHVKNRITEPPYEKPLVQMNEKAQQLAGRLAESMADGRLEPTPAMLSLALLTLVENPLPPRQTELRDALINQLLALRDEQGAYRASDDEDAEPVNHTTAALATAALASAYDQTRRATLGDAVQQSFETIWNQTRDQPNINSLPWLMLARQRGAGLWDEISATGETPKLRNDTIASMVDVLVSKQIVAAPQLGPADVVGGFDLTARSASNVPNPNWTSAQLLAFIALAARQPEIREGHDDLGWILTAGLAARYCRQLMVNDQSCYYMRSPADAIGGVRLVLWDNRLTLNATAMTLLAVTEFEQTLEVFEP